MVSSEKLQNQRAKTIGDIYEAALDHSAFVRLGSVLARGVDGSNGVVVIRDAGAPVELSTTATAEAMQSYMEYYGRLDPWAAVTLNAPLGFVTRSEKFISDGDLDRNEFYVDYARHLGMVHPAGTTLSLGPQRTISIGVSRPRGGRAFEEADERWILELAQHVQRAMQLRAQARNASLRQSAAAATLETLTFGAIVLDAQMNVVHLNSEAEAIIRRARGLGLTRGHLSLASSSETRRLSELVRSTSQAGVGGAMQISDGAGTTVLIAVVAPLTSGIHGSDSRGLTLVALRPAEPQEAARAAMLSQLFGFTNAEAQLASALANGKALEQFAIDRGLKTSTLRTQLLAIFRKTGTNGQRDLVRLIGAVPQVRT